ncbi:hypothetical protein DIPPA_26556 [Diplonema papillatum]|nr:hypothetical protein DIPPA_26556 [Diplonema papillatum]
MAAAVSDKDRLLPGVPDKHVANTLIPDHYARLGLQVGIEYSDQLVSKHFRQLAARLHPDRNAGSDTALKRFQLVSEAFHELESTDKRQAFEKRVLKHQQRTLRQKKREDSDGSRAKKSRSREASKQGRKRRRRSTSSSSAASSSYSSSTSSSSSSTERRRKRRRKRHDEERKARQAAREGRPKMSLWNAHSEAPVPPPPPPPVAAQDEAEFNADGGFSAADHFVDDSFFDDYNPFVHSATDPAAADDDDDEAYVPVPVAAAKTAETPPPSAPAPQDTHQHHHHQQEAPGAAEMAQRHPELPNVLLLHLHALAQQPLPDPLRLLVQNQQPMTEPQKVSFAKQVQGLIAARKSIAADHRQRLVQQVRNLVDPLNNPAADQVLHSILQLLRHGHKKRQQLQLQQLQHAHHQAAQQPLQPLPPTQQQQQPSASAGVTLEQLLLQQKLRTQQPAAVGLVQLLQQQQKQPQQQQKQPQQPQPAAAGLAQLLLLQQQQQQKQPGEYVMPPHFACATGLTPAGERRMQELLKKERSGHLPAHLRPQLAALRQQKVVRSRKLTASSDPAGDTSALDVILKEVEQQQQQSLNTKKRLQEQLKKLKPQHTQQPETKPSCDSLESIMSALEKAPTQRAPPPPPPTTDAEDEYDPVSTLREEPQATSLERASPLPPGEGARSVDALGSSRAASVSSSSPPAPEEAPEAAKPRNNSVVQALLMKQRRELEAREERAPTQESPLERQRQERQLEIETRVKFAEIKNRRQWDNEEATRRLQITRLRQREHEQLVKKGMQDRILREVGRLKEVQDEQKKKQEEETRVREAEDAERREKIAEHQQREAAWQQKLQDEREAWKRQRELEQSQQMKERLEEDERRRDHQRQQEAHRAQAQQPAAPEPKQKPQQAQQQQKLQQPQQQQQVQQQQKLQQPQQQQVQQQQQPGALALPRSAALPVRLVTGPMARLVLSQEHTARRTLEQAEAWGRRDLDFEYKGVVGGGKQAPNPDAPPPPPATAMKHPLRSMIVKRPIAGPPTVASVDLKRKQPGSPPPAPAASRLAGAPQPQRPLLQHPAYPGQQPQPPPPPQAKLPPAAGYSAQQQQQQQPPHAGGGLVQGARVMRQDPALRPTPHASSAPAPPAPSAWPTHLPTRPHPHAGQPAAPAAPTNPYIPRPGPAKADQPGRAPEPADALSVLGQPLVRSAGYAGQASGAGPQASRFVPAPRSLSARAGGLAGYPGQVPVNPVGYDRVHAVNRPAGGGAASQATPQAAGPADAKPEESSPRPPAGRKAKFSLPPLSPVEEAPPPPYEACAAQPRWDPSRQGVPPQHRAAAYQARDEPSAVASDRNEPSAYPPHDAPAFQTDARADEGSQAAKRRRVEELSAMKPLGKISREAYQNRREPPAFQGEV